MSHFGERTVTVRIHVVICTHFGTLSYFVDRYPLVNSGITARADLHRALKVPLRNCFGSRLSFLLFRLEPLVKQRFQRTIFLHAGKRLIHRFNEGAAFAKDKSQFFTLNRGAGDL